MTFFSKEFRIVFQRLAISVTSLAFTFKQFSCLRFHSHQFVSNTADILVFYINLGDAMKSRKNKGTGVGCKWT